MKDNFEFKIINEGDPTFPRNLLAYKGMPKTIYVSGKISEDTPRIAIVGTRKATIQSQQIAYEFARQLSNNGFIVVSGLALGIDTASHNGTLEGPSPTWAVMGSAINNIYPRSNERLAMRIIDNGGCIISEHGPNNLSFANSFVLRNRIISALSDAIVVIEAPEKSGALATAEFAKKQGKKVFVVPGPVSSAQFAGSFNLIRKGATLVSSVKDITEELGMDSKKNKNKPTTVARKDPNESLVVNAIKSSGKSLSVDNLCQMTTLNAQEVNISLTNLIIDNIIKEDNLGRYFLN